MKFVSNRDLWFNSKMGHILQFIKGVPMDVPRPLHAAVMEKGILPVEDDGSAIDPEKTEVGVPETKIVLAPEDQMERDDKILEVIKAIIVRNNPKDFTGGGQPSAAAISASLGWKVDQVEVRKVWENTRESLLRQ